MTEIFSCGLLTENTIFTFTYYSTKTELQNNLDASILVGGRGYVGTTVEKSHCPLCHFTPERNVEDAKKVILWTLTPDCQGLEYKLIANPTSLFSTAVIPYQLRTIDQHETKLVKIKNEST